MQPWKPPVLAAAVFALMNAPAAAPAQPFQQTLISTERNLRIQEWRLQPNPWGLEVRKTVLHGGKQEGVDLIEASNGTLRFVVIPTRGMSLLKVVSGDLTLGWNSPVKEIVHPRHINLESRGGLGWLAGFNEWMVRCGLEFAGHPGRDQFINNLGDQATMDLTLHGKIGNTPASEVEVIIDPKPPHRMRIRGRVDERMFYGPQLELWTEISTTPGSRELTISDSITNRGASEQEFQIIYHTNFGPPLLEKGTKLLAPIRKITPFNDHAAQAIGTHDVYAAPTPNFIEQVYCIRPWADDQGNTTVMLQNAAADRGVSITFSLRELPFLTQWKNTAPLEAGYVTGIEPSTGFPYNRRIERAFGRVPKLRPGQTRNFKLDFMILPDAAAVQTAAAHIAEIQAGRKTEKIATPEVDLRQFN